MKKLILLFGVLLLTIVAYSQPIVRVDTIVEVGGEPIIADVYQRGNAYRATDDYYRYWITRKMVYVPTMEVISELESFQFTVSKNSNLARWQFFTQQAIIDTVNNCVIDTVFSIPRR